MNRNTMEWLIVLFLVGICLTICIIKYGFVLAIVCALLVIFLPPICSILNYKFIPDEEGR